jgi:hypothetical protein
MMAITTRSSISVKPGRFRSAKERDPVLELSSRMRGLLLPAFAVRVELSTLATPGNTLGV